MKKIFFCFCAVSLGLMLLAIKYAGNSKTLDPIVIKQGKQYSSNIKMQTFQAIAISTDLSGQQLAGGYLSVMPYTHSQLLNFK